MADLAKSLKALADPTRVQILEELAGGALCVGVLAARLGVTHSAVSQQLRVLREAGLVEGKRCGYRVHYSLNREALDQVSGQFARWARALCRRQAQVCGKQSRSGCTGAASG